MAQFDFSAFAQGMSEEGAGVPPQAAGAQESIQRKLMGDDMVDRYGDVLGARPRTFTDRLRDFTIGMAEGPKAVRDLQFQVLDTYRKRYDSAVKEGVAAREQEIAQAKAVFEAINFASKHPGHATGILKSQLRLLGVEADPVVLKMFTDADLLATLPTSKIVEAFTAPDGPPLSELLGLFTNPTEAAKFLDSARRYKTEQRQIGREAMSDELKGLRTKELREKLDALPFERRQDRRADVENLKLTREKRTTEKLRQKKLQKDLRGGSSGAFGDIDEMDDEPPVPRSSRTPGNPIVGIEPLTE